MCINRPAKIQILSNLYKLFLCAQLYARAAKSENFKRVFLGYTFFTFTKYGVNESSKTIQPIKLRLGTHIPSLLNFLVDERKKIGKKFVLPLFHKSNEKMF